MNFVNNFLLLFDSFFYGFVTSSLICSFVAFMIIVFVFFFIYYLFKLFF